MFIDVRYWCLLIGTFIVIGTGSSYYINADDVAEAIGAPELADKVDYAYWLSAAIAILGGGLIASIFNKVLNAWLFAAIAAFTSMVGFGLVFLAESNDVFFYISAFLVGAGTGGWWVIVPQIIIDDAGPKSFETLWGLTLTVNAAGIFAFDRLFWWISEKTETTESGACDGQACYLIPYVASGVLCLIAGVLAIVAWNNDVGTGGAGGEERKKLKDHDGNSSSRLKEGKRGGSSKKDKKSSSKSKSKSKSKGKKK